MKKRYGTYIKVISFPVFEVSVHICITQEPDKFLDQSHLRQYLDHELSPTVNGFVFFSDKFNYYLVIPPGACLSTLVHECDHVINFMFGDRGVEGDFENDELHAYHLGYLASEAEEFRKKVLAIYKQEIAAAEEAAKE